MKNFFHRKAKSPHPAGYTPVGRVAWGKSDLGLKLAQNVQPSSDPKWSRPAALRDKIPHFWLLAGCLAACIGLLAARGWTLGASEWPVLSVSGVSQQVFYGGTALTEVKDAALTRVWSGPVTLAVNKFGATEIVASVLKIKGEQVTTTCQANLESEGLLGRVTGARCTIVVKDGESTQIYQASDTLSANGQCWQRTLSPAPGAPATSSQKIEACDSSGRILLPWALPAGVVAPPF